MKPSQWYQPQQLIDLGGQRLYVHDVGDGPVLLCLHGLPGASWSWHKLMPHLDGFRVIAPDLLGFGHSDKPGDARYSVVAHSDRMEDLLKALDIRDFHVMGQGLGAMIGLELMARAEGREAEELDPRINPLSLFLINAPIFPELSEPPRAERWLASQFGELLKFVASRNLFWQYLNELSGPYSRPTPMEVKQLWQLLKRNEGRWILPAHARYHQELMKRSKRWVRALRETRRPLRLVAGPEDPVAGHRLEAAFRRALPDLRREMIGKLGHAPQFESADKLSPLLKAFHNTLRS
ncbi:alpha/beta fold hydrolase [Natronospira bacteriovora]|uniref:Alpha/beta hydrolase n=1 Tax=Natronospira bacteriovora TaxID=3069753 RepID=A0ABU0W4E7_9GAMM|nr:alpha/beta hydrolase [Natronospira sp. AB-CW4]MDQ2068892.1 alpha/beta hydrolase [Natronospira sp. AB-CW4]